MRLSIGAACVALAFSMLAGCGQQGAPEPGRLASAASAYSLAAQTRATAALMDLLGPQTGIVGLQVQSGTGRSAHFAISTDGGRTFRPFGPVSSNQNLPDSVFALDSKHIWLATFPAGGGAEQLYRTSNGGRSWQQFSAPAHVLAAGSTDEFQFVTATTGWLTDIQPTGPIEELLRSTDGGARWRCVASASAASSCPGRLPQLGPVRFEPGGLIGWLGGGMFSTALFRSVDGGTSWQRMPVPAPRGATFGQPAVLGRTIIQTATVADGSGYDLLTFVSQDNGAHWKLESALRRASTVKNCLGAMSASFPTASAGWAAAYRNGEVVIYRSTALGRPWRAVADVGRQPPSDLACAWPQIMAADSAHAWLAVETSSGIAIYASSDGGGAWRRIDQAADAAG